MHLTPNGLSTDDNYHFPNERYGYESPVSATPLIADCCSKMTAKGEKMENLKAYIIYNLSPTKQMRWPRGVENLQAVIQSQGISMVKKCPLFMDAVTILHSTEKPEEVLVRGGVNKVESRGTPDEKWRWNAENEKGRAINLENWE